MALVPQEKCLRVEISPWDPYVDETDVEPDTPTGILIDVMEIIAKKLGICRKWVWRDKEYAWGDIILDVENGTADMAVGPFGMTLSRKQMVNFIEPFFFSDYNVIYPRPGIESDVMGLFKPLEISVWIAILISFLFTVVILSIYYSSGWSRENELDQRVKNMGSRVNRMFLMGYASLLRQPVPPVPDDYFIRICFLVWISLMFIASEVYKNNLTAMLILPRVKIPFDSVEELAVQSDISWTYSPGAMVDSTVEAAAAADPNGALGKLHLRRTSKLFQENNGIEEILLDNNLAGIYVRLNNMVRISQDFHKHKICRLALSKFGVLPISLSFVVNKNLADLKNSLDKIVMSLREFGIAQRTFMEEVRMGTQCFLPPGRESDPTSQLQPLKIKDFAGLFAIYLGGLTVATLLLIGEVTVNKLLK